MTDLKDGNGGPQGIAEGVSQQLRESLLEALGRVFKRVGKEIDKARRGSGPLATLMTVEEPRMLDEQLSESQNELTHSLTAIAPGSSRPAVELLLTAILRPRGSRVSGVLQRRSSSAGDLGMSFAISDLSPGMQASRFTLWESPDGAASSKTEASRFHALCAPAAMALSVELIRRSLLRAAPKPTFLEHARYGRKVPEMIMQRNGRYRAAVNMLIGVLYQVYARRMPAATTSFYALSIGAVESALQTLQHWQIYEVLADSQAEYARRLPDHIHRIEMFGQALGNYDKALDTLKDANSRPGVRASEEIRMAKAITLAAACAYGGVALVGIDALQRAFAEIDETKLALEQDPKLLYGWACAYAIAHRAGLEIAHPGRTARHLLVLCWARSEPPGWWEEAKRDLDLESVLQDVETVQFVIDDLRRKCNSSPLRLDQIQQVLLTTGWDKEPTTERLTGEPPTLRVPRPKVRQARFGTAP
jgi:hypothetical protein